MSREAVELASVQAIAAAQARQLRRVLHVLRDVGVVKLDGLCFCAGDYSGRTHLAACLAARRELLALKGE